MAILLLGCRSDQTNKKDWLSYAHGIKPSQLSLSLSFGWTLRWASSALTTFNGLHFGAFPCTSGERRSSGDVATNDADAKDATSDIGDGEPPRSLNAEDEGAMPYVPDASM